MIGVYSVDSEIDQDEVGGSLVDVRKGSRTCSDVLVWGMAGVLDLTTNKLKRDLRRVPR